MSEFTALCRATGRVLYSGTAADPAQLATAETAIAVGVMHVGGWVDADGHHHEQPARPSLDHDFDWIKKVWHDPRTLQDLKALKWSEIRQARDRQEANHFPYLGRLIDSDARSVQRITTAVQSADAAQRGGVAFLISWTCADNSTLTLDAQAMQGMPVALAQYADSLHQEARALHAQIEAATTAAQLDTIAWSVNE